jgi:hypothetical protein
MATNHDFVHDGTGEQGGRDTTPEQVLARPPRVLSQPQRASYFENGCLLVERAIPADTVARLAIPVSREEPRYDQYDAPGTQACLAPTARKQPGS